MPWLAIALLAPVWGYFLGVGCGLLAALACRISYRYSPHCFECGGYAWAFETSQIGLVCVWITGPVLCFEVGCLVLVLVRGRHGELAARCLGAAFAALAAAVLATLATGWLLSEDLAGVVGIAASVLALAEGARNPRLGTWVMRWGFVDRGVAVGTAVAGLWLLWRWGR